MKKIKPAARAWSWSAWDQYEGCPAQYRYARLERWQSPACGAGDHAPACRGCACDCHKGPALVRGSAVHALAERYVKRELRALPAELRLYQAELAELIRQHGKGSRHGAAEGAWAFTRAWAPTAWFGDNTWLRVKTDDHALLPRGVVRVIDYKTGRVDPRLTKKYELQLGLYAVAAMHLFDGVGEVQAELWFLDHHVTVKRGFAGTRRQELRELWERRVARLLADRRFDPKPGDACRWCPFTKARGGPCRY